MRRIRTLLRIRRTVFVYDPFCRRAGTSRRPYAETSRPAVGAAAPGGPQPPAQSLPRARGRWREAPDEVLRLSPRRERSTDRSARPPVMASRSEGSCPRRRAVYPGNTPHPTLRRRDPSSVKPPQDDMRGTSRVFNRSKTPWGQKSAGRCTIEYKVPNQKGRELSNISFLC